MDKHTDYIDQKSIVQKRWIKDNFRASWWKLAVSVAISLGSTGLQLLNPWPLKILIDSVFGTVHAPGILGPLTGTFSLLIVVAMAYVGLYLVGGLVEIIDLYLTTLFTNQLSIKLQTALFYHILNLPIESRSKIDSGDYVYRLNEQADNLAVLIFSTFVSIISNSFMIVAALVILALLNWQMAIVGILVVPLLYISIRFFTPRIGSGSDDVAERTSDIYNASSESIENTTLIQSFNRQDFQTGKFRNKLQSRANRTLHLSILDGSFSFTNNICTAIGVMLVLLIGGNGVFHHTITIGELLIFITYMSYLYDPIESILSDIAEYRSLLAGVKLVNEVQVEHADIPDPSIGIALTDVKGAISFKDVSFNRDGKPVLEHVSFDVLPGQKVAFVGPSGSGKSTILSLVPRFIRPTSGYIYLDGHELKDINLAALRSHIGIVLQEPGLLSGTIHENIGFAIPDDILDLPDIMVAAKAANAYDFITTFPEGFETEVGEGGSKLSGGQKQRVSIARAFVKNPPVLLLDEPTSALDTRSSKKIISAIKKLMDGKTVLLATHETSLLSEMDVVYVIDNGSVIKISDPSKISEYTQSLEKSEETADSTFSNPLLDPADTALTTFRD